MVEEEEIKWRLQGIMAEKIFELLHIEIGCQIFRTGQEFLYPTLLNLANTKKKLYQQKYEEDDYKHLCDTIGEWNVEISRDSDGISPKKETLNIAPDKKMVAQMRFVRKEAGISLSSSPDFTIITPSGNIEQFEVKYRAKGILSEEEKEKYLFLNPKPYIFIVMKDHPFIKLLEPCFKPDGALFSGLLNKHKELVKNTFEPIKFYKHIHKESTYSYSEIEPSENGDLIIEYPLKSEYIIYPKKVLNKYEKVIKETFKF